jgi:hypothetical protein
MMKDLIEATQTLKACIVEGQQNQPKGGKEKEVNYSMGKLRRLSLFKKGKSRQYN